MKARFMILALFLSGSAFAQVNLKYQIDNLGTTPANGAGLWFANTTSAAAGLQQVSPSLVFEGQGWKTNATAASQSVKFMVDVLPIQNAFAASGSFRIRSSINGGAYTEAMNVSETGTVVATGEFRSANQRAFDAISSTSTAAHFTVDWYTGILTNLGSVTQGHNVFLDFVTGVQTNDRSALIEYTVMLTKADGSDNCVKRYLVAYRKDGAANPVVTGAAVALIQVGNVTPTVNFTISGGLPQITVNDAGSGGWNIKIWADVTTSN